MGSQLGCSGDDTFACSEHGYLYGLSHVGQMSRWMLRRGQYEGWMRSTDYRDGCVGDGRAYDDKCVSDVCL